MIRLLQQSASASPQCDRLAPRRFATAAIVCALFLCGELLPTLWAADGDSPLRRLPPIETARRLPPIDAMTTSAPATAARALAEPSDARPVAVAGAFPALPPDPAAADLEPLPPLEEELWNHGGSYLYAPEGDRLGMPDPREEHFKLYRLPETFREPRPLTAFQDFLGADPIAFYPNLKWPGPDGFHWEPQFVAFGSYQLFGLSLEQNNRRQDGLGHQLVVDLDLRVTGTERVHVQYRPIGERGTGGSFWQLSEPTGYIDNSTATPDRYWIEGEMASLFSGLLCDQFAVRDVHVAFGKMPFALHNNLLINDEIVGLVVNKNTLYLGQLSNVNVQAFYAFNDVDSFANADATLYGTHLTLDWRRVFFEATYANVQHETDPGRESNYAALSVTKQLGQWSYGGRTLFKWGDETGRGSGELFVVESAYTRYFSECFYATTGIEYGVFYANAFHATQGWNSIGGGNFNRLRSSFETNPLVSISIARAPDDNSGLALGVQLFRHDEDESFIPEIAFESPGGQGVFGMGFRYLRKTGPRSFFELLGVYNASDDPSLRREGVFAGQTIVF